jgi:hypothetical protein
MTLECLLRSPVGLVENGTMIAGSGTSVGVKGEGAKTRQEFDSAFDDGHVRLQFKPSEATPVCFSSLAVFEPG